MTGSLLVPDPRSAQPSRTPQADPSLVRRAGHAFRLTECAARGRKIGNPPPLCGMPNLHLLIDKLHPYETVERLRDVMAQHGGLYDNGAGVPVRIRSGRYGKFAQLATKTIIVLEADKICQPYVNGLFGPMAISLPPNLAQYYLEHEDLGLPPLNCIVTTPLLQDDGSISKPDGYDPASGMVCYDVPDLTGMVPRRPTQVVTPRSGSRSFSWCRRGTGSGQPRARLITSNRHALLDRGGGAPPTPDGEDGCERRRRICA
jgi:hypothetical protein